MEILHMFGFDWKLFIGQLVNFLVLVYIFKRFLYKPVLSILKEREDKVKKGLEDAEKTHALLEQTSRDKDEIMKKTRAEAQDIIESTRKMAEDIRQEMLQKSKSEAGKIVDQAQAQAVQEMEKMQKEVKKMSLDLSQKILLNTLQTLFTEEEQKKIMLRAVEKLQTGDNDTAH